MPSTTTTTAPNPTPPGSVPILVDFLNSVPTPLTVALVGLAPSIAFIRHAAEIVSWNAAWDESWLVLAAWWAVCLLAEGAIRYLLPLAIFFVLAVRRWTSSPRPAPAPVTELNLQSTISDLTIIQSLLPRSSQFPQASLNTVLRVSAILYVPYLLLTYFIRLRVLLAIAGTVLLSWRASWARAIRYTLWRSAWLRWSLYYTWSFLSGNPIPALTLASSPSTLSSPSPPTNTTSFLFTIYENQRWWVGLDWTAALFPNERPSWCSLPPALTPVAPPAAFALPGPSTVFLRDSGRAGRRVRRTATWRWEESEWRVVVRREGEGMSRVEKPLPSMEVNAAGNIMARTAGRARDSTGSAASGGSGNGSGGGGTPAGNQGEGAEDDTQREISVGDLVTDADGWVYGDNKWEGHSSKGGIGKYTRYRRWTRIAILSEVTESVEPGPIGSMPPAYTSPTNTLSPLSLQSPALTTFSDVQTNDAPSSDPPSEPVGSPPREGEDPQNNAADGRGLLRNRLRAIVDGASH